MRYSSVELVDLYSLPNVKGMEVVFDNKNNPLYAQYPIDINAVDVCLFVGYPKQEQQLIFEEETFTMVDGYSNGFIRFSHVFNQAFERFKEGKLSKSEAGTILSFELVNPLVVYAKNGKVDVKLIKFISLMKQMGYSKPVYDSETFKPFM